ncbi:MAG TPA: multidrug efflux SMR transporter [Steroidobacteraceae bacterium]|nr:multidrug efflux SMR transporter [Steroidobacteraceae bacterium]
MAWVVLVVAGIVEIVMAIALKYAAGWTRLWPSVLGVAAALASIVLLTFAVKQLPVTTAYAVWTGIGAVGVSLVGIFLFGESAHPLRLACMAAVFGGMIGLHLLEGRI